MSQQVDELDAILPDICPLCGAKAIYGYGLMGGGCGSYVICDTDGCEFFQKKQDTPDDG